MGKKLFLLAGVALLAIFGTRSLGKAKDLGCGEGVLDCYQNSAGDIVPTLINGRELDMSLWKYVVRIRVGNSGCSATVVGPRVAITAAHCGTTGATAYIAGTSYSGVIERSSIYPGQDHDLAVIILQQEMPKSVVGRYATVGGTASVGTEYFLAGYGCTQAGGAGGSDGKLRGGHSRMTGTSGFDMITGGQGQAALCFGDSGGPLFLSDDYTNPVVLGTNSKGNIRDTNYNLRHDIQTSKDFLVSMAQKYQVKICGINGDQATCGTDAPTPPPPPPPPSGCSASVRKQLLIGVAECFEIPINLAPVWEE